MASESMSFHRGIVRWRESMLSGTASHRLTMSNLRFPCQHTCLSRKDMEGLVSSQGRIDVVGQSELNDLVVGMVKEPLR